MIKKLIKYLSFVEFIKFLAYIPYKVCNIIIACLILIGTICNYNSVNSLPMFEVLVIGFVAIAYLVILSIKQTYSFYVQMKESMSRDKVLFIARKKLEKKLFSNSNWLISLFLPALIVPVVIYMIKYPLGLPIKIFAYSALYVVLFLCFIGYSQYVSLILMANYCYKQAAGITQYNRNRPHKTEWIVKLAALTNKQSNLFFLVGTAFIALLYLITFSGFYAVPLDENIDKILVIYLWGIEATAIVVMFPIFSACSYLFIKNIITKLVENEIRECNCIENMAANKKKRRKQRDILLSINQLKIIMLERNPVYPQKPLASYAFSYIIAIINFAATVEAALSLINYIP